MTLSLNTTANQPSRRIPKAFSIGIPVALVMNLFNSAAQIDIYRSPFSTFKDGTTYELTSQNTIRVSDSSDIVESYNFNSRTVTSGKVQGVRHGGGGYGGMLSFDSVAPDALDAVTAAGCDIAQSIIPSHRTSWFYKISFGNPGSSDGSFDDHKNRAAKFAEEHCLPD